MTPAQKQALKDMTECKIDITVFQYEKVMIEINNLKNETNIKIDFRYFNGKYKNFTK